MKPFDTKGEYTPEEVKAALAGIDGTRQLSFRYARLDRNNTFIEDIDYVQSCSIENNSLADIKRTAKFDILDTGRMNYLQDRIKPYIRIAMTKDDTYTDYIAGLSPISWWKMDEPASFARTYAPQVNLPSDNTSSSSSTAYSIVSDPTKMTDYTGPVHLNDAAIRSELWFVVQATTFNTIQFDLHGGITAQDEYMTATIYFASTIGASLEKVYTATLAYGGGYFSDNITVNTLGFYYVQFTPLGPTIANPKLSLAYLIKMEDSSGNGVVGSYDATTTTGSASLIGGTSGTAISRTGQLSWYIDEPVTTDGGPILLNYWVNFGSTLTTDYWSTSNKIYFDTGFISVEAYQNDGTSSNWNVNMGADDVATDYDSSVILPISIATGTHMISIQLDISNQSCKLWVDGVYKYSWPITGSFTGTLSDFADFKPSYITNGWFYASSDATTRVDDMTIFGKTLGTSQIQDIYKLGLVSTAPRSGYVEWPQGVFLLSSPERVMVDGNYVHRDVEGYDGLVVLKEDSFDYRYSVPAGTKYTDAVQALVTSGTVLENIDMRDPLWVAEGDNVITSESSVLLSNTNGADGYTRKSIITKEDSFAVAGIDFRAKYLDPESDNDNTLLRLEKADYSFYVQMGVNNTDSNIYFEVYSGLTAVSSVSIPYVQATHQWWRITESKGFFTFYTSSNGTTWTARSTVASPFAVNDTLRPSLTLWPGTSAGLTQTATYTNIKLTATRVPKTSITKSTSVLPTALEWDIGTSRLDIVNDLLNAVNYESASYDENGVFIARPYNSPDKRTAQFTYATDASSVITGDVNQTVDMFKIPNKWIVVVSDPDRPALVGTYTNTNPASPTSIASRGRTIVDYRTEQKAADQITLDAQAARLAFEASQVYEVIEFETALMPIHQNADVINLSIDGLAVNSKYAEHNWSMDLKVGGSMKHTVRKVVSL